MNKLSLIIFDCDGTLTDSEVLNNQALLEVLYEDGFTHYTLDYAFHHWVGTTVSNVMLAIQMETGRMPSPDTVQKFVSRVAHKQKTELKAVEGADDVIAAAARKYKVCVASNGERSNVLESLSLTGLKKHFVDDHVFTKIQVKNPKPHPDLFLFAANQMGAAPENCVVIEDSATGVRAGVAAGITTFGFTGASHDPVKQAEILKSAGAAGVFSRLIHIREHLGL